MLGVEWSNDPDHSSHAGAGRDRAGRWKKRDRLLSPAPPFVREYAATLFGTQGPSPTSGLPSLVHPPASTSVRRALATHRRPRAEVVLRRLPVSWRVGRLPATSENTPWRVVFAQASILAHRR